MGKETIDAVVGIVTAIIGLAVLSVLVSGNAQTGSVIKSLSGGLAQDIQAATSPVSGGSSFGSFGGMGMPMIGESQPYGG